MPTLKSPQAKKDRKALSPQDEMQQAIAQSLQIGQPQGQSSTGNGNLVAQLLGQGGQENPADKSAQKAIKDYDKQLGQMAIDAVGQGEDPKTVRAKLLDTLMSHTQQQPAQQQTQRTPAKSWFDIGGDTREPGSIAKVVSLMSGQGLPKSSLSGQDDPAKTRYLNAQSALAERNLTGGGIDTLPQEQQLAAMSLARKIGGVRGMEKVLPMVVSGLQSGKTPDQLEDEIRFSQQSIGVTSEWRNAAQSILGAKTSETQRNVLLDTLDDYRQNGDDKGAKEYLKNIARDSADSAQKDRIMGKERTVDFLDEIQTDLNTLEQAGIGTGFLRGNMEDLVNRIGKTVDPRFAKVATKIAVSVINYRNAMSGVAFGEKESADYRKLFPAKNKLGDFNTANITAIRDSFKGDTEKFYQQRMGEGNYKKLFDGQEQSQQEQGQQEDFSKMSDEELRRIAGGK